MDDLISRKAAIEAVSKAYFELRSIFGRCKDALKSLPSACPEPIKINIEDFNKEDWERLKEELRNTPITVLSAQPEIIRCKDCKHYYYTDNRIPQEPRYVCDLDSDRWYPDDYCSYAERKTNDWYKGE